ncbi:MAG: KaiC 1 [Candidatus Riflebacteria bacterium HGW-Riflebacteria-1]|nr:MAG: KaiC 1 [Candidatus Riflebacteria bacterium HGW-Riflebacteria-1]
MTSLKTASRSASFPKVPTGIPGLDEITEGGLPLGRSTMICGGPGCGKTMLGMEFLVRGARDFGEAGLFISFEEEKQCLVDNFSCFGGDLEAMIEKRLLKVTQIDLSAAEIIEAGSFSLDGLIAHIEHDIKTLHVKRLVIDSLDALFSAMARTDILRHEFSRLLRWLKSKGVTAVITGERGVDSLTKFGFEAYASDCVILLDHRINEQISKRRLRIIKYRGSSHGKDEYPYLINARGFSVLPVTSLQLNFTAESGWVSSGIKDLDKLCGGNGYYRGSSILLSGKAGTGKSSLSSAYASAACLRGEKCLYFSFEESEEQLTRNMLSVGIDMAPLLKQGLLNIQAFRPNYRGLEEHLFEMTAAIEAFQPTCVVIDPITNFVSVGTCEEVKSMLTRIIDHLKSRGITMAFTALTPGSGRPDETETDVSSMVDTWVALDLKLVGNSRRREIYVVKSRGMKHSHEICELEMSKHGFSLRSLAKEQIA